MSLGKMTADEAAQFDAAVGAARAKRDESILRDTVNKIAENRNVNQRAIGEPLGNRVPSLNAAMQSRYQVLNPGKPLPPQFVLAPDSTTKDFDRVDKLMQQTEQAEGVKAARAQAAATRAQAAALQEQGPVFAYNPKTKQRELTTVGDAKAQGLTNAIKATQSDVDKAAEFNAQANDVQMNTSRAKAAYNAMSAWNKVDVLNGSMILSDPTVNNALFSTAGFPAVMSQIVQGDKAKAWNALSPDKQDAIIGYLRMKGAAIAYQKMLTNQGRTSKEGLDIELANIPSPIVGATAANKQFNAFQENIDTAAQRAVRLPWMETPQDVRARIEAQASAAYNQRQASTKF